MNPGSRSPTRKRLGTAINEVSTIEHDFVVGLSNQPRTQDGGRPPASARSYKTPTGRRGRQDEPAFQP